MAIVSKAVFEKVAGKSPSIGTQLRLDRYVSANKGLSPLEGGGKLYLVTVRPPDEALWLVAVLDDPEFSGSEWVTDPCTTPITDISPLKASLVFENGKGLPTTKGTLGMSLQTPRVLTAADVALLDGALAGAPAPSKAGSPAVVKRPAAPEKDLAREELAQVDLALRQSMPVYKRRAMRARRDELLANNSARWWPYTTMAQRQKAGQLVYVRADASELMGYAAKLFAAEPVTELDLYGVDEESIGDLAKAAWLGKLTALGVHSEIGDEAFATLVKSKHLSNLVALNVSGNGLSSEGLDAMKNALPSLQRLVLTNNPIGDEGCGSLAAWKHLGNLRTLYLTACEITDEGIAALADSGKLGALEKLTLANNEEISDAGIAKLASTKVLPNLRYLELKNLGLKDAAGQALADAKFPHMKHLDVRGAWGVKRDKLRAVYRDAVTE
jgi:Leucine-rich repeat (LRR) protein